jgi:hypothetical protein
MQLISTQSKGHLESAHLGLAWNDGFIMAGLIKDNRVVFSFAVKMPARFGT